MIIFLNLLQNLDHKQPDKTFLKPKVFCEHGMLLKVSIASGLVTGAIL
jgi:hypothetical protein